MQHSSATTIVLVLLVSTTAFSGHQYAKQNPEAIVFLVDRVGDPSGDAASERERAPNQMDPLDAIRCAEQKLRVVSADLRSELTEKRSNALSRAQPLIKAILSLQAKIDQSDGSTDLHKREARMIALRATYVGAREIPEEYAHPFVTIAQSIVQREAGSEEAAEADALILLDRTTWDRPDVDAVVGDLARFADSYPDSLWAVSLWGLASEEYQKKGLAESAKAVLQHGVRFYTGQAQAAVLVDKLAEQGHGAPRETQVTEKQSQQRYVSTEACAKDTTSGSKVR